MIFALADAVEHFFEAVKFNFHSSLEKEIWFKSQPDKTLVILECNIQGLFANKKFFKIIERTLSFGDHKRKYFCKRLAPDYKSPNLI